MVWLPDREKSMRIRLLVLTEFMNVTDGQTDSAWRHRLRLHSIAITHTQLYSPFEKAAQLYAKK